MRPLLLVDWREVNALFCVVMWIVVLVLAVVVLIHASGHPAVAQPGPVAPLHAVRALSPSSR